MGEKEGKYNKDFDISEMKDFLQKIASKYQSHNVQAKAKSFFDVSGYPHYENVVSNILQFYLDPGEEHGFKDLWLSALMECYSEKNQGIPDCSNYGEVYEIYREFSTEKDKRIDLLIKTDNFLIVIENKIYAGVSNPFYDYHNAAEKEAGDNTIIEIILSIREEKDEIDGKYKFINITYDKLVSKVLSKYGEYVSGSNYKWQLFMNEFINNIMRFYEAVEMKMDKEWNILIKEKGDILSAITKKHKEDIDSKREWLQQVGENVGKVQMYGKKGYSGYHSIYINIKYNDVTYSLEPYYNKEPSDGGWGELGVFYICVWERSKKDNLDGLKKYLEKNLAENFREKELSISQNGGWGNCLLIKKLSFSKDEDMNCDNVVKIITTVEEKIRSYANKVVNQNTIEITESQN